jgi:glutamyl-tRNA synthetase
MPETRTRFAPSPTGFLHLGSARTALFNWAFARRHAGRFVLRVEDTDLERSSQASESALLEGLEWLGLHWDEGPHRQSERRARPGEVSEELLSRDRAYRCVCTRDELEERRKATIASGGKWTYDGRCREANHGPGCGSHTVRLRLPEEGSLSWDDLVYGPSGQDAREIGDRIIRRSDGGPLYHLAVVVDDIDMGIDHVIRGADHHSNTPFQLAIYHALDATPPALAHLPLIVGEAGKKLSKRRDAVSIEHFREEGYLPEALCNWLVRMGWSHGDQEIFSLEEIAGLFGLEPVGRSAARADPDKLLHLNRHYIKTLPTGALLERLRPFLEAASGQRVPPTPQLERLVDLHRERAKTLVDMARLSVFLVAEEIPYDEKAAEKHLSEDIAPALSDHHDRLTALEDWSEEGLERVFEATRDAHGGISMGKLAQPVRVAVTGGTVSPGIFATLAVLGRKRSLDRIAAAIRSIAHG